MQIIFKLTWNNKIYHILVHKTILNIFQRIETVEFSNWKN